MSEIGTGNCMNTNLLIMYITIKLHFSAVLFYSTNDRVHRTLSVAARNALQRFFLDRCGRYHFLLGGSPDCLPFLITEKKNFT